MKGELNKKKLKMQLRNNKLKMKLWVKIIQMFNLKI